MTKVNILTGSKELGEAFARYLKYVMDIGYREIRLILFNRISGLSKDILDANLWIIEAFNPSEPDNPEGFRTALKLAGKKRFLIYFLSVPNDFPEDGPFWCVMPCSRLKAKIEQVLSGSLPTQDDMRKIIDLWPKLVYNPNTHHSY